MLPLQWPRHTRRADPHRWEAPRGDVRLACAGRSRRRRQGGLFRAPGGHGQRRLPSFFAGGKDADGRPKGAGEWYTISRGWDGVRAIDITDIDGDGKPDLLALRVDGTLVAHVHQGVFDPERPLSTFREPVAVAVGWNDFGANGSFVRVRAGRRAYEAPRTRGAAWARVPRIRGCRPHPDGALVSAALPAVSPCRGGVISAYPSPCRSPFRWPSWGAPGCPGCRARSVPACRWCAGSPWTRWSRRSRCRSAVATIR